MIPELVLLAMIAVIAVQLFAHWRLRGSKNGPTSSKDNGEGGGGGDAGLMLAIAAAMPAPVATEVAMAVAAISPERS
jgi:hypothetical protein